MADRIITMRALLRENLENLNSPLPWKHITEQIGAALLLLPPASVMHAIGT